LYTQVKSSLEELEKRVDKQLRDEVAEVSGGLQVIEGEIASVQSQLQQLIPVDPTEPTTEVNKNYTMY
jgi:chromosome segregation ATPase